MTDQPHKKILVIDDDADIRQLIKQRLEQSGYEVAFAADATTALTLARRAEPDLVLLDLTLPGGDGFMVLERMKHLATLAHVPVVAVSARAREPNEARARELGAVAYVQKPFSADELMIAVESALGHG
jgi:two-component system, cell cycle response regulator DivK